MLLNNSVTDMYNYMMFSNLINTLCEPLIAKSPIDHFGYIEVDCDGGVLFLESDISILQAAESKDLILSIIKYLISKQNISGKYHLDLKSSMQLDGKMSQFAHELNINHCMLIVKHGVRNNKNVIKYFIFTSLLDIETMTNYYFNNLETINSFTKYIEKKIKNLLYSKRKMVLPELKMLFNLPDKQLEPLLIFNDLPQPSKFTHLTTRELEMISLYVNQSATAKETAVVLNISIRTVEKHWENIRMKLNYIEKNDIKKIFNDIFNLNQNENHAELVAL